MSRTGKYGSKEPKPVCSASVRLLVEVALASIGIAASKTPLTMASPGVKEYGAKLKSELDSAGGAVVW